MTLCRSGPGVSAIVLGKCDSSAGNTQTHTHTLAYARMHICDVSCAPFAHAGAAAEFEAAACSSV
jgi:hypothetical protein